MDFITRLPRCPSPHNSLWVIVDRVTKSSHFLLVNTTHSAEDYVRLYTHGVVKLHGVQMSFIQI